jgi:hypothetical protein
VDAETANGLEQEKTEATEIFSFRSLFSLFAPVQKSFICFPLRHLRANLKTCHRRRTCGTFVTLAARVVKWQTRQT